MILNMPDEFVGEAHRIIFVAAVYAADDHAVNRSAAETIHLKRATQDRAADDERIRRGCRQRDPNRKCGDG